MKNLVTKILLLAATLTASIGPQARAAGTSGAHLLQMGAGARAAGMGDAFTALSNDVTATFWNPAGLGQLKQTEISFMHNQGLIDTQYQYIGAGMPYGKSALGFSLYRLDHGTIDRYTVNDTADGSFTAGSMAGALSIAGKLSERTNFGFTAKYIHESIETYKATGFAADFGALMDGETFSLAATLRNLGTDMKMVQDSYDLPQTATLGAAARLFDRKLLIDADLVKPLDGDLKINGGAEYNLGQRVFFRAGYSAVPGTDIKVDGLSGVTGGLGLAVGPFTLDYAFIPFGELGNTHRLSVLIRINRP